MLFKHQLPGPVRSGVSTVLDVLVPASSPTSVYIAVTSGTSRLYVYRWDRFLGVVEAPNAITSCRLVLMRGAIKPSVSLFIGCQPAAVFIVENLEATLTGIDNNGKKKTPAGFLRLGVDQFRSVLPEKALKVISFEGGAVGTALTEDISSGRDVFAVVETEAAMAVCCVSSSMQGDARLPFIILSGRHNCGRGPMLCTSTGAHLLLVIHSRTQQQVSTTASQLYSAPLPGARSSLRSDAAPCPAGTLRKGFASKVIALVEFAAGEAKDVVIAVEETGWLSLLPVSHVEDMPENGKTHRVRLRLGATDKRVRAAVVVGDFLACLSSRGVVWLTPLSNCFSKLPDEGPRWEESMAVHCARLNCAPNVVAVAASPSSLLRPALFVLTQQGRLLCFQDLPFPPLSSEPPLDAPVRVVEARCEEKASLQVEAILRRVEDACRRTQASHLELAKTEEDLKRLRAAWAVAAGKGFLVASIDVTHASSPATIPAPSLKVRLQNATEDEAFSLQGWSLMLRVEGAAPSMSPDPVGGLLRALSPPGAGVLVGASWPLPDLGPREDFQAETPLPDTGSLLPLTARLSLCLPFLTSSPSARGDAGIAGISEQAGVCLELGSRPLDMLDLAHPVKSVPATPSEVRALEVEARKQGRGPSWERCLARHLLADVLGKEGEGGAEIRNLSQREAPRGAEQGGMLGSSPRPLLSSTLRILWPVLSTGREHLQNFHGDAAPCAAPLPALADILGACDGARMSMKGQERTLAIQAPEGEVLLARLLAGDMRVRMDASEGIEAMALQLKLYGTDQGLLSLLRATCCQRLGPGASVRTRRLLLTDTRMKTLESVHHQLAALAAELQNGYDVRNGKEETDRNRFGWKFDMARRTARLAVVLSREVDEAFLLDLRPDFHD